MRGSCGYLVLCLWLMVLCVHCDNPFFPKTGEPDRSVSLRQTPQGVINQLLKSYETKNISLFRDLFSPHGTYRFYVSKSYVEYSSSLCDTIALPLVADILPGTSYYYWTYPDEISKHEKMFSEVDEIVFTTQPIIPSNGVTYFTSANNDNDTTYATVILRDGEFTVTASQVLSTPVDVAIEEQVFYLARDPADPTLWVIDKWFDLGTQD
ncbi:MAG: hypothetical protein PHC61_03090 [Chitinivibrionales bacterium]|nr:hypothetical protein [Chitinivibrionales bacterium]